MCAAAVGARYLTDDRLNVREDDNFFRLVTDLSFARATIE
jgi:hypothetical protein